MAVMRPPAEDVARRLAEVRAGLAELESRLLGTEAAARAGSPAAPSQQPLLVRMTLELEERMLALQDGAELSAEVVLAELREHLDELARRVLAVAPANQGPARNELLKRVADVIRAPRAAGEPVERAAPGFDFWGWSFQVSRAVTATGLVLLVFLAYEFGLAALAEQRSQVALLDAFHQAVPTTTLDLPNQAIAPGSPVALLEIPDLGLRQVVVEGTAPDQLKAGPGHLSDSPLPGEFGNSVILGRRTTYGAPFVLLNRLRPGSEIDVTTGQGIFVYTVAAVGVTPSGSAAAMVGGLDNRLTLVTSDPWLVADRRFVVVATLQGLPIGLPSRPAVALDPADLGLAGDPGGAAIGFFWAGLLVLAIWAARRFRHHWPGQVTPMLAAPVIAALAIQACWTLDRLLPGTL